MKRKPIDIVAGLLNAFNTFQGIREYNLNEIKNMTEFHWETIHEYIIMLKLIQEFSPTIEFDAKEKKVKITAPSQFIKALPLDDQIMIYLFINKIFDETRSIPADTIVPDITNDQITSLKTSKFIQCSSNNEIKNSPGIYLTKNGKFRAQGILASIYRTMSEFIENKGDIGFNQPNFSHISYTNATSIVSAGESTASFVEQTDPTEICSEIERFEDFALKRGQIFQCSSEEANNASRSMKKFQKNSYVETLDLHPTAAD